MKFKIVSNKKYERIVSKLAARAQFIQLDFGGHKVIGVVLKPEEYAIPATSAVNIIESLTKKISLVAKALD